MSKFALAMLGLVLSLGAFAQDMSVNGFNKRFKLVRDDQGKVTAIKVKSAVSRFTIMPFIEQIKSDLLGEQSSLQAKSAFQKENDINDFLTDLGYSPFSLVDERGAEEAREMKASLMNIQNININQAFQQLVSDKNFWKEFEAKLNEAFLFVDPTVMTNLDDARFFYRKAVTHKVVTWALQQAEKKFAHLPILNIASFVIVRVHDMMMEQRHFHHSMLLHYFENVNEAQLGMTKEEVDRAVSSIYEYRISPIDYRTSSRAAADWLNFGFDRFYQSVRQGDALMASWKSSMSGVNFSDVKKLNFAFAEVNENGVRKIYHLHNKAHMFSSKPALAFDYSKPYKVRMTRSLLNLGEVALGFVKIPGWIKSNVTKFSRSIYVQQVRMEGALTGYFESTGNMRMLDSIYAQRANFYIVK